MKKLAFYTYTVLAHVYVHCALGKMLTQGMHTNKYVRTKTKLLILLLVTNIRVLIAKYQLR